MIPRRTRLRRHPHPECGSTTDATLRRLYEEQGQSPWLDNLTRPYLRDGTLLRLVAGGIRGVTANPTIFARAIEASDAYDEQFHRSSPPDTRVEDAYWDLVVADVVAALEVLRPTFDTSDGGDGFVSIEVAPDCAHDTEATERGRARPARAHRRTQPVRQDPRDRRRRPRHRGDDRRKGAAST